MNIKRVRISNHVVLLVALALALCLVALGCKRKPQSAGAADVAPPAGQSTPPTTTTDNPVATEATRLPVSQAPQVKLSDVVRAAKSWTARPLRGSIQAADFSLPDLEGTVHQLSSLRGKQVILAFWASWSAHSEHQLTQLVKLRSEVPVEDLAILAISLTSPQNSPGAIKLSVAGRTDINFPVLAVASQDLPAPFNNIQFLPCHAFITPQGQIKLITEGQVPEADFRQILQAQ